MRRSSDVVVVLLISAFLAAGLFAACSQPELLDGDIDHSDSDSDDPCAPYDCSPGACVVDESRIRYQCPEGYGGFYPQDGCIKITTDGDEEREADRSDGDAEQEAEAEFVLRPCDSISPQYPCLSELPFEYTDEEGRFRIISEYRSYILYPRLWNGWVSFYIGGSSAGSPYGGEYAFNVHTQTTIHLHDAKGLGSDTDVNDGKVLWTVADHTNRFHLTLYGSSLDEFKPEIITDSPYFKRSPRYINGHYYWYNEPAESINSIKRMLMTLNDSGEETQITDGGFRDWEEIEGNGSFLVYTDVPDRIILYDLASGKEQAISQDGSYIGGISLNERTVWYSRNDSSDGSWDCGWFIVRYDLESGERSVFKQIDGTDLGSHDVWGDWLLYASYAEGGADSIEERCAARGAHSDLILHYLPTGEEWDITQTTGVRQKHAQMWDSMVVWIQEQKDTETSTTLESLHGINLCMHPELKERFESCKTQKKKANSP